MTEQTKYCMSCGESEMKTLQQLQEMSDSDLDEAVVETQGWYTADGYIWRSGTNGVSTDGKLDGNTKVSDYHPTKDTEAGRSQAFELMVKHGLDVSITGKYAAYNVADESWGSTGEDAPQRAICIAVILSQQGVYCNDV